MPSVCDGTTIALRQAEANLRANLTALAARGELTRVPAELGGEWEFAFARDGTLTARRDVHGGFWGERSVPTRAAQVQLRAFSPAPGTSAACLLAPAHPADARAALGRLRPEQALIVLLPAEADAALFFRADDFSAEIGRRRLFVAWGEAWPEQLRQTLLDHPGLAIPGQFVKLNSADAAAADAMIAPAQAVFSQVSQRRADAMAALQASRAAPGGAPPPVPRLCVLAGSRYRLWNDSGMDLLTVLSCARGLEAVQFDVDDPLCATPLSLALAAGDATAVVSADVCRADAPPGAARADQPWIAWLTRPRPIPPFAAGGPKDGLLLADPSMHAAAVAAGWPADRVRLAGWPVRSGSPPARAPGAPRTLAIVADVGPLDPPEDLNQFSSHRLLWEWLAEHFRRAPLAAADAGERLLREGMAKLGVQEDGLPMRRFVDDLAAWAFAVGVARLVWRERAALRIDRMNLHGDGWDGYDDLSAHRRGAVRTREQFRAAVAEATAILHVVPSAAPHPVDAAGRPVARYRRGAGSAGLFAAIRSALEGGTPAAAPVPPLDASAILGLLN